MPEMPRYERRDGDVGTKISRGRHQVTVERQLCDVEVMVPKCAEKQLLRLKRQICDLASVHLNATVPDRARAVVFGARDRNGYQLRHRLPPYCYSDISA